MAMVTHDLKAPVCGMISMLQASQRGTSGSDLFQRTIPLLISTAESMRSQINDI